MELTALLKRRFWLLWVTVCLTTCTLGGCFSSEAFSLVAGDLENIGDRRPQFYLAVILGMGAGIVMGYFWCRFMRAKTAQREAQAEFEYKNTLLSILMTPGVSIGMHLIAWIVAGFPDVYNKSDTFGLFILICLIIIPMMTGLLMGKGFARWWKLTADHAFCLTENPSAPVRSPWRFGWLIIFPCGFTSVPCGYLSSMYVMAFTRGHYGLVAACLGGDDRSCGGNFLVPLHGARAPIYR